MVWPAIIGAIGSIGSGLLSSKGAASANRQQMEFNKEEAEKNRGFQKYMSNTAYFRGMHDMRSAGLNPILAGRLGGASSPAGSAANVGSLQNEMAGMAEGLAGATSAFQQNRQTSANIQQTKAQTENIRAQTRIALKQAEKAETFAPGWRLASDVIEGLEEPVRDLLDQLLGNTSTSKTTGDSVPEAQPNSAKKTSQQEKTKKEIEKAIKRIQVNHRMYKDMSPSQRWIWDKIHGKPRGYK